MKEVLDGLTKHLVEKGFFLEEAVEMLEKSMIAHALANTTGNQCEAAKHLGIHRNTLLKKMVEYEIDGKRPRRKAVQAAGRRRPAAGSSFKAS